MDKMISPAHPGDLIREDVFPAFGIRSVIEAAEVLNVARPGLNNMLNGKRALSHEMALKIEAAFGVSADLLVNLQSQYDLAKARLKASEITSGVERRVLEHA